MSASVNDVVVCDTNGQDLGLASDLGGVALRKVPAEEDFPLHVLKIGGRILINSEDDWLPCVSAGDYHGPRLQNLRYPPTAIDRDGLLKLIAAISHIAPCGCSRPTVVTVEDSADWQRDLAAKINEIWTYSANARVCDVRGRDLGVYHQHYDRPVLRNIPKPEQFPLTASSLVCKPLESKRCEHCSLECECKWLAKLQSLVAEKAVINGATPAGDSPLIVATRNGQIRVVASLLKMHADVTSASARRWTALHEAARQRRRDMCRGLMLVDEMVRSESLHTVSIDDLGIACAEAMLGTVRTDTISIGIAKVLHRAIHTTCKAPPAYPTQQPSVIRPSALRALVNYRCSTIGSSSLMEAVASGCQEIIKDMVSVGGIVNIPTDDGTTALMKAAGLGDVDLCSVLIRSGAHLCEGDPQGRCCVRCTVSWHTPLRNAVGESAISIALAGSRDHERYAKVMQFLRSHGVK